MDESHNVRSDILPLQRRIWREGRNLNRRVRSCIASLLPRSCPQQVHSLNAFCCSPLRQADDGKSNSQPVDFILSLALTRSKLWATKAFTTPNFIPFSTMSVFCMFQYGDGDGKDMSHKRNGRIVEESASKNRGSRSNMPGDRRARGKKK